MTNLSRFRLGAGAVLAAALAVCGCGTGGMAVVRGDVAVDGVPLSDGSVTFEAVDGSSPSIGTKITNGKFEVPADSKLTPGKKKLTIRGSIKTGKTVQAGPPAPPGVMVDELQFYPPPGGEPEVREVDVVEGVNQLRIDMTAASFEKK